MNWFSSVFAELQAHTHLLSEGWRILGILFLGAVMGPVLLNLRTLHARGLFVMLVYGAWDTLLPAAPLGFLDGRISGLQDEVLLIALLVIVGVTGLVRSIYRLKIDVLAFSIAALMVGALGYTYHLVLINGMDDAQRRIESAQASDLLDLGPDAWNAVCALPHRQCGEGLPHTGSQVFDKDLADWMEHALPAGRDGRVASSDGTLGATPPHVWAAERVGGSIRWIRIDRTGPTSALELAFYIFLNIATVFWFTAAVAVEVLHRRAFRRRGVDKAPGGEV